MTIFFSLFGAFVFAVRGGQYFNIGSTTVVRLIWSVYFAVCAAILAESWFMLASVATMFLGLIFGWTEVYQCRNLKETAGMAGRLAILVAPTSALMYYAVSPEVAWLYPVLAAPVAVLGHIVYRARKHFNWSIGHTEINEHLIGFWVVAAYWACVCIA